MARQLPDLLPSHWTKQSEIPSEFLEPYLKNFLMVQLEYFNYCGYSYEKIVANLKGVETFTRHYGGLHSRMAVSNIFDKVYNLDEKKLREFCVEIFGS